MYSRLLLLIVVVFPICSARVYAGGDKGAAPSLVLSIRSARTVIDQVKHIVSLAGRENVAGEIESLIKARVGPNGLEGIDADRPLGGYARLGQDLHDVMAVVMLPIANEDAFLSLLKSLNLAVSKDKGDLYTLKTWTPVPLYLRFANKYAYVSALNLEALEPANLLPPEKVFGREQKEAVSASFRIDQIPAALKEIATFSLEQELAKMAEKRQPNETQSQWELHKHLMEQLVQQFKTVLDQGSEIRLTLDIKQKTDELSLKVELSGKKGSKLAKQIHDLGTSMSLFAHLAGPHSASAALVHLIASPATRKAFANVVEEGKAKALSSLQDETKRKQASDLLDALVPTLEAAEVDAAFTLNRAPKSQHYNFVTAIKLVQGTKLAQTLHRLMGDLQGSLPDSARAKIKLDAETAGAVKIHRVDIQDNFDAGTRAVLGDNPLYFAFRDDAFYLAAGEDALAALKKALMAASAQSPPLEFSVSVARLAKLLARAGGPEIHFPTGDAGAIRLVIEGGNSLRLRLTTQLSVVQFFRNVADGRP